MWLICPDMIGLKSRGKTCGMPICQGGDHVAVALRRRRWPRRRFRQGIPQVICCHDSLSYIRDPSVGGTTEAQQNGFDDGRVIEQVRDNFSLRHPRRK
jgi:hypothetical protein